MAAVLPTSPSQDAGPRSEAAQPTAPADDEGAPWPDGATGAEVGKVSFSDSKPTAATEAQTPVADAPLPALDTLVTRIPAEVREALDDLFRVKFVNVQRMPASSLKE